MTETTWLVQPLFTGVFMVLGLLLFYQTLGKTVARLTQHDDIKVNFKQERLFVYSVIYWMLVSIYLQYRIGLTGNPLAFLNFGILITFYVLLYLGVRGLIWVNIGTIGAQLVFLNPQQYGIDSCIGTVIIAGVIVLLTMLVQRLYAHVWLLIVALDLLDILTWTLLFFIKTTGVPAFSLHVLFYNCFAFIIMNACLIYTQNQLNEDNSYIWSITDEAAIDDLTQIPNFGTFRTELQADYNDYYNTDDTLNLISLDVDHFKRFNDQYGHLAGDQILRELGQFLNDEVKPFPDALPFRVGGEEFNLLLPHVQLQQATQFAQGMQERLSKLVIRYGNQKMSITVSVGVAQLGPQDRKATDFYQRADELLYHSKAHGRNRVTAQINQ
ncbi:GGDEF domain-containing protein [Secundilactobacillus collinoides]|uniref:GGDEF domain-containing protein n=1 Tax=Secundilactobacillus collinoides TaxID=33960 RepID=A0A166GBY4_SECCO|nr:GGDEF domain-containing protein [Secundilactobacillus collinoides]KZL38274.1 hypothetical protein TY91_12080 [Secundilactobacillus collinoides]